MNDLQNFNAFGLITIRRKRLTASVTVVSNKTAINRSFTDNNVTLPQVASNETAAAAFGAWMEAGKPSKITVHEIGELRSGEPISNIPQVKELLKTILEQAKKGAELE